MKRVGEAVIEDSVIEDFVIEEAVIEESVLRELAQIKRELVEIKETSVRTEYEQICEEYATRLQALGAVHRQRKAMREQQRSCLYSQFHGQLDSQLEEKALERALERLKQESRRDSAERRDLKRERAIAVEPLARSVAEVERRVRSLKQKYAQLSREWQMKMRVDYFAGLAGKEIEPLEVLYEDADLIVVNKPAGLLAVPGRSRHLQDSVVSRLWYQMFGRELKETFLQAVHRLDRDTSGVMAIALSPSAHANLSQQFAQRQVHKVYEAILSRPVNKQAGTVTLPLWGCPQQRPRQVVNREKGKPSRTDFKVLSEGDQPRVELVPHTGRTHQLRVHMAHVEGLNAPILGDTLYGSDDLYGFNDLRCLNDSVGSLCLHARELSFVHPVSEESMRIGAVLPF